MENINLLGFEGFLLSETVVNIRDLSEKEKIAQEVWDMMVRTYEDAGIKFLTFRDIDDMVNDSGMWKLIYRKVDGKRKLVSASISKDNKGMKSVAVGYTADGKDDAKKEIMTNSYNAMRDGKWGEVSGGAEYLRIKTFGTQHMVPNKFASEILKKEVIPSEDGYHYTRMIMGEPHEKLIIGTFTDKRLMDRIHSVRVKNPPPTKEEAIKRIKLKMREDKKH